MTMPTDHRDPAPWEKSPLLRRLMGSTLPEPLPEFPEPWQEPGPLPAARPQDLKVLIISHMFPYPGFEGSGPFVAEQTAALRSLRSIDARVISPRYWGMHLRNPIYALRREYHYRKLHRSITWRKYGQTPVRYPPFRVWRYYPSHALTYRASIMRGIDDLHAEFPFDLVHAHTGFLDGTAGLAIARRLGVPLVITEHTSPFEFLLEHPKVRGRTLAALEAADLVIAVSRAQQREVASHLSSQGAAKVRVIPNGVDMELFGPHDQAKPDPAKPRILYAGGSEARKNPTGMLAALAKVREQIPGARLIMTGSTGDNEQDSQALRQLIADSGQARAVDYVGFQDRASMARLMRGGCDIFALASHAESFGVVLIEALSCGHPVVATDCGGPADIVTDESLGELVAVNDVDALAQGLLKVITRLDSYDPMHIREHVRARYSFNAVSRQLEQAYLELLSAPPLERTRI